MQELTWDAECELTGVADDQNGDGTGSDAEAAIRMSACTRADGERLVRIQNGTVTAYLPGQEVTRTSAGAVLGARYYTFAGQTVAVRTGNLGADVTSIFAAHHGTGAIPIGNVTNTVTRRFTDPFGAPRDSAAGTPGADESGSDWTGDRGFLDKTTDATGLTSVGARYYDQLLGAFISVDPVMDMSSPQQWNAYSYAGNNPVTWSDPTGLWYPECHDGSHSCSRDSDGNTRAKRNWDRCERGATSCVKRENTSTGPVYVRECYTAYSCQFYSTHSDGFESSSGHNVSLRDQTVSAAERAAQVQKAREQAELKRAEDYRADQAQREQKNGWLTAEKLTSTSADFTGYVSLGGLAVQGIGTAMVLFGANPHVIFAGGALKAWGAYVSLTWGLASSALALGNATINYKLGRRDDGNRAMFSAMLGFGTAGFGAGAGRLAVSMGRETPYINEAMLSIGSLVGDKAFSKE